MQTSPPAVAFDGVFTRSLGELFNVFVPGDKTIDWPDFLWIESERQVPSDVFDDIPISDAFATLIEDLVDTYYDLRREGQEEAAKTLIDLLDTITDAVNNLAPNPKWLGLGYDEVIRTELTNHFNQAQTTTSPLILDLDGDGVETTALTNGVFFDHDGNGFAEQSGWVGKDDGLLVLDRNGNGSIDGGSELFGNNTTLANGNKAANGFAALRELDSNLDGVIDANDAAYASLRVWKDADGDGITDEGELLPLEEAGVARIALNYTNTATTDANGNQHLQTGSFTRADGTTATVTDVWFQSDLANTLDTHLVAISDEIAALPDVVAFGNVHDLRQAMARDESGQLQALVEQFVQETDVGARHELVVQIIYRWTGVQNIDPESRTAEPYGNYIGDARKLEALEAFLGEEYFGTWCNGIQADPSNPHSKAAPLLLQAFTELADYVYSQLMLQTHFSPLLNLLDIKIEGDGLGWDVSALVAVLREQSEADQTLGLLTLQEFFHALESAGSEAAGAIHAALRAAGSVQGSTFDICLAEGGKELVIGSDASDQISGDSSNNTILAGDGNDSLSGNDGNDTLYGQAGNDTLNGGNGDDTLYGGDGGDWLYGGNGSDVLDGGADNDRLYGGAGNDTYLFGHGDGDDVIASEYDASSGKHNVLQFKDGVAPEEVSVRRSGNSLVLTLAGSTDRVTVNDFFLGDNPSNAYNSVQSVRFADGTVWAQSDLVERALAGTDGADSLVGTVAADMLNGGAGNDTVNGGNGDDTLYGGDGGDWLYGGNGSDVLDGGADNDRLYGGAGNDTYLFGHGDGDDVIASEYDASSGKHNVLQFKDGVAPEEVSVRRSGNSLVLTLAGSTDRVTVNDFFLGDNPSNAYNSVQSVRFADGTVWAQSDLVERALAGTDGADSLVGTVAADMLNGGAGNDTLNGGRGNDTYLFARTGGQDTLYDYDTTTGNTDVLAFGADIAADQLWFQRNGNNLDISIIGTTDKVTVSNWYVSNAYHVEQLKTADGLTLLDSQVNALVSAMAAFAPPSSGQTTLPQGYQDALSSVIAANWQ
ncbi:RTX toxin [Azoarcus sp. TTM-91]|uniref:calcium-binding protein n=1 Tax=Azoarcus sp. TTM-91 TaxID=2691581 RepID=UPI00145E255E|nr:calcium-binding protein [Azoarcus sp. TTM-91]NMG35399.1 RTX toxin [Azoarcus sp. TTM-91]